MASKVELPFALIHCTYPAPTPVASAFAPNNPGATVATVTAPVATEVPPCNAVRVAEPLLVPVGMRTLTCIRAGQRRTNRAAGTKNIKFDG